MGFVLGYRNLVFVKWKCDIFHIRVYALGSKLLAKWIEIPFS